ncbi:MAG: hypothetical protein AAGE61_12405 [Pseudomonadota bacterium]
MSASQRMWDPFDGEINFKQEVVAKPRKGIKLPDWIRSVAGILLLVGFALFFVGFFYRDILWVAAPCAFGGAIVLLGADYLNNSEKRIDFLLYQLAKKNNWGFEILPSTNAEKHAAVKHLIDEKRKQGRHVEGELPMDPRIRRVRDRVGDLLDMKVGRMTMIDIDAFFWGNTTKAIPFWMAFGIVQSDMTLAAPSLKTDAYGNTGNQAYLLQMLCAYKLDRDTDIRARLLHESILGESRHDFQTESVEFNRQFNISIADRRGNVPENASAYHQALLQALTPATQATLIELKRKYDVQVVIENDIVFYAGWDKVNTSDFDVVGEHLSAISEAFADSAVSFKRYVE